MGVCVKHSLPVEGPIPNVSIRGRGGGEKIDVAIRKGKDEQSRREVWSNNRIAAD